MVRYIGTYKGIRVYLNSDLPLDIKFVTYNDENIVKPFSIIADGRLLLYIKSIKYVASAKERIDMLYDGRIVTYFASSHG